MAKNLADIALEQTKKNLPTNANQAIQGADPNLMAQQAANSQQQLANTPSPIEAPKPNTNVSQPLNASNLGGNQQTASLQSLQSAQNSLSTQTPVAPAKPHVADAGELAKAMAEADVKKGILKAPETEEEKQAREKKEKRNKWLSRISDAVSAASNLVTASQGGVSVFNPENSMSKRWSDAYEKQKAEREKNNQMYFNAYNNYMKMAQDNIDNLREYQRKSANDAWNRNKDAAELQLKQEESQLKKLLAAGQISEAQYKAEIAASNAKYADAKNKAEIAKTNAQIAQSRAAAANSYANVEQRKLSSQKLRKELADMDKSKTIHYTSPDGNTVTFSKTSNGDQYINESFTRAKADNASLYNKFIEEKFGTSMPGESKKKSLTPDEKAEFVLWASEQNASKPKSGTTPLSMGMAWQSQPNDYLGIITGDSGDNDDYTSIFK